MLDHWLKFLAVALSLCAAGPASSEPLKEISGLTADQIVQRALGRAQLVHRLNRNTNYSYQKTTVIEELDGKGRVTKTKEKLLQFQSGVGTLKEMKVNGKPASLPDKKQEAQSVADRQQMTRGPGSKRDDNWGAYLNKELVARYHFELLGREDVAGRQSYVLKFQPRDKLPVKQITDRLINRLGGKVWIDAREFEVAKAEIDLLGEVTMWGGMLGAMKKFSFDVERARVDDVWFNRVSHFEMEGRKVFDSTRLRVKSESGNFHKTAEFHQ